MKRKLKNYTSQELLAEVIHRGLQTFKFHDSVSAQCFKCQNKFLIKWIATRKSYAKKNSWDYWTGKKSDKDLRICNSCLRSFYVNERQEFLTTIKDLKKRNHLRSYVSHKVI